MEMEIEERLQDYFRNITIQVEYVTIRTYKIEILNNYIKDFFEYIWDAHHTTESNINFIINKIQRIILKYYKKGE